MCELILQKTADGRLSDRVYVTLLEAIIAGRLSPGDVVSEVSLARDLNVSRTPVHDAVRKLIEDGLVTQAANHRPVIAAFKSDDVFEIFEMRKLLEGEAAARAAPRIDRSTLAKLREIADGLAGPADVNGEWLGRWADFDEVFHAAIAQASGSKRLDADIARYRLLHRGFNKLATADPLRQALDEHLTILDALDQRNAADARHAMVMHIGEWQAYFVNYAERTGKRA
ncbi:MAG: FCD domain-containing protein [Phycisphaera sp.]|nr:FCD domain-containing protein [Phycisphaera sp.]